MKITKNFNDLWNLRFVLLESSITSGILSLSIMSLFYYSIGMTNEEIALSQSIFSVVMIFLDLPMGWIADRLSRKWANIIGDFGEALVLAFIYARANNLAEVAIAECLLAVFCSLSAGVDSSLLRHFSQKIDKSEKFFRSKSASLVFWQNLIEMLLVGIGGLVGAISYRLTIALSSVTFFMGGVISLFINDDSEKLQAKTKNPLKDLARITQESLKNKKLRLSILARVVGTEITHSMIWFFTPMLIYAGIPAEIVSMAWVFNSLSTILGARLAKRFAKKSQNWQLLTISILLASFSMGILSISISIWTIPFYLLMGIVRGWSSSTLKPRVGQYAKSCEQTSVFSLASTISRLLYAITGLIIGKAGDIDLRFAALANLLLFIPLGIMLIIKLKREDC